MTKDEFYSLYQNNKKTEANPKKTKQRMDKVWWKKLNEDIEKEFKGYS